MENQRADCRSEAFFFLHVAILDSLLQILIPSLCTNAFWFPFYPTKELALVVPRVFFPCVDFQWKNRDCRFGGGGGGREEKITKRKDACGGKATACALLFSSRREKNGGSLWSRADRTTNRKTSIPPEHRNTNPDQYRRNWTPFGWIVCLFVCCSTPLCSSLIYSTLLYSLPQPAHQDNAPRC